MSWIGRFLELSLHSDDVLADMRSYEARGFRQLATGDIWPHRYGVVSDGSVNIGLHSDLPEATMLTFVHPNVYSLIDELMARGIEPAEVKLGPDEFNLIRFYDPNETAVQIIEARTFSPPSFEERHTSELGRFSKLQLPIRDQPEELEADKLFWQRLGLRDDERDDEHDDNQTAITMMASDYAIEFNPRLRAGEIRLKFVDSDDERAIDLRKL